MTSKVTKDWSYRLAKRMLPETAADYDMARDFCDGASGGELDCFQLDLLTDWTLEAWKNRRTNLAGNVFPVYFECFNCQSKGPEPK